jgi:uncharacterized protein (DUF4415 family)
MGTRKSNVESIDYPDCGNAISLNLVPFAIEKGARSNTDWDKVRILPDSDVVFSEDAPETSPEDWADAVAHKGLPVPPRKTQIALRVDNDVLAWFKAQGAGYQTRMNSVLKEFRDAHVRATKAEQ